MTESKNRQMTIAVTGMKCGGCETNIKNQLTNHDGIISVEASHIENNVNVVFDETKTNLNQITKVIEEAGFSVENAA